MKRIFLSFASAALAESLRRIERQAKDLNFFDEVHALDQSALEPAFRERFGHKLTENIRGFGYWCWKPQIILQVLQSCDDGDCLLYLDSGCHLNRGGLARLGGYFRLVEETPSGVVAFQQGKPVDQTFEERVNGSRAEYVWTKGDLIDHLGARDAPYLRDAQAASGSIFFRKSAETIRFVEDWLAVYDTDFRLVDDRRSRSPNYEGFKEHRHDQSVFSILCKQRSAKLLPISEVALPPSASPDWSVLKDSPIQYRRDRTKVGWSRHRIKFSINRRMRVAKRRMSRLLALS